MKTSFLNLKRTGPFATLAVFTHCTKRCWIRQMPSHHQAVARWLPVSAATAAALYLGSQFAPWIWMWAIAFGLFVAAKWLTVFPLVISTFPVRRRRLIYYAFWPGLNASRFCLSDCERTPRAAECLPAICKTLLGAILICLAPTIVQIHPLLGGWMGMVGIVLLLHFGLFDLLASFWRARGFSATPLMNRPLVAKSLSDFWSRRWNTAFSDLARRQIIAPLARLLPANAALLIAFIISGLLHELVISVPAGGGFGLPTAYFALQGAGQVFERSDLGARLGLRAGWPGRVFFFTIAVLPVGLLFPPVFVRRVIIPMLEAL